MTRLNAIAQVLTNGLIASSMYALVAVGYTLIYGVLKFINFAHGDVAMVGGYVAFFLVGAGVATGGRLALGLMGAAVVCAVLGMLIERLGYRPLRNSPRLLPLITAIGIGIALQALVAMRAGSGFKVIALPDWPVYRIGPVAITAVQVAILLLAAVSLVALQLLVHRTDLGAWIRAVADNRELAYVLGVDVDRVIRSVFAIGSALAGVAGVMLALEINLQPAMGFTVGIKAFAAVVLGGIGSIPGMLIGSLVIGFAENLGAWFISGVWKESIAYGILLLTLLIRPSGLLGARAEEEVKL